MTTKVEELRLPATVIGRLIKDALPPNASVSKEARTAVARAAAVFVLNMTTFANDYAVSKKRKTIGAEDVYQAVKVLECEQIESPLREAVELWTVDRNNRTEKLKKKRAEKKANGDSSVIEEEPATADDEGMETDKPEEEDAIDEAPTAEPKDIEDMS